MYNGFVILNTYIVLIPIITKESNNKMFSLGVNVSITTYGNRTVFGLHASKEFIPNQEQLDLLLNKYIPEELDFFYHNVSLMTIKL